MEAKAPHDSEKDDAATQSATIDVVVSAPPAKSIDGNLETIVSAPPAKSIDGALETDGKPADPPKDDPPPSSIADLFRFATPLDVALTTGAIICAMGHGVVMPLFSLIFGDVINALNGPDISSLVTSLCLKLMGIAIAAGVAAYFQVALANVAAVRQVRALREAYVRALLRQDVAWCDAHPPGEAGARLTEDTAAVEDGVGAKFAMIAQAGTTFLAGFVLAFSVTPDAYKMALVLLGFLPLLGGVMAVVTTAVMASEKKGGDAYGEAGEVATEALGNIRTVAAYGGEGALAARYDGALGSAETAGVRKAVLTGVTIGVFLLTLFLVYGISLMWGAQLVIWSRDANPGCYDPTLAGCFTGGTVLQVLFALIMGAGSLGQLAPSIGALNGARAAAGRIYAVVDRVPPIDSRPPEMGAAATAATAIATAAAASTAAPAAAAPAAAAAGMLRGRIEFRDVTFAYPSRPTVPVLANFFLTIEAGERLALCGPSGCGKSTLVALIQRWYDVQGGGVFIDGVDVRQLPVQVLRAGQALVSQESLLLAGDVTHNIALGNAGLTAAAAVGGAHGTSSSSALTIAPSDEAVRAAARAANAHAFIAALPRGYETPLTNASLSGGQRQRLCIARALLRSSAPILLLDEATSALDTASEQLVQAALDALLAGGGTRTTVTIAHRLSTIDGADRVVVLSEGRIVESGPPAKLMAREGGVFRAMREAQALAPGAAPASAATVAVAADAAAAEAASASVAAASETSATASVPELVAADTAPAVAASAAAAAAATDAAAPLLDPLASDDEPPSTAVSWLRIASYNKPEALWAILGLLSCCVTGATMPAFALILSRFIAIYYNPINSELWSDALLYMGVFIAIGVANFIACVIQQFTFGLIGERLVRRVRSAAFGSLLRFEVGWHDKHPAGAVTAALGSDAYLLKSATGATLALNVQNLLGLAAGLAVAFAASWQITLVVLACAPLLVIGGALQIRLLRGSLEENKKAFEESGAIATEALSAPRTLAAYALQDATVAAYTAAIAKPTSANLRAAWASGIGMSLMATMMIGTYAIIFGVGSVFISQGIINFQELLQALFGVMFAAMGLGNSQGMAVDGARAGMAARSLFRVIDRVPRVPSVAPPAGASPPPPRALGDLSLRGVGLKYPGREGTAPALAGVDIDIPHGSLVALVGASGSGKTSIVSLLERFYEPSEGAVLLDGRDIRTLPLDYLRRQMAWVQQEPSLFNATIAYNVGFPDVAPTSSVAGVAASSAPGGAPAAAAPAVRKPPSAALEAATRSTGAHEFVQALPEGYETRCGTRGSQLSGGQKQRLCIARALLRDAPILLLDEATSALDTASEQQVQVAVDALLDKAADERRCTAIVIAHRLSTVKKADVVIVLERGRVIESGKWADLAAQDGGHFRSMLALQGLV